MASRVFQRLAEAEARVHGTTPERVHFHDVGAVDAIVDVTGACIGLHLLGVDAVHVGALPVGGGFVEGPHGRMPVPGPATAELLKGFPTLDTGIRRELVTPTGAAILTTLAAGAGTMPAMRITAVGYGAGTMDLETPNVLRLFVGEASGASGPAPVETIVQVETTVDDMSPQLYEPLLERLLEAGALDVWLTPVIMKRSRPGVVLTVLCEPARVADLSRLLFEESSTIGVRWTAYQRARLEREMVRLDTAHGPGPSGPGGARAGARRGPSPPRHPLTPSPARHTVGGAFPASDPHHSGGCAVKKTVSMTINGAPQSHEVEPRLLLVHYIREQAGLTGTHVGCDTSQCGACTVHVNGMAVKSCTLLAVQCDGAQVLTIEGLAKDGKLHPIQDGFWEKHGLQCGFCTPGMIMSAHQMLQRNPRPTEAQIRHDLEGNLCRCTGYHNIVKAIQYAAEKMAGK